MNLSSRLGDAFQAQYTVELSNHNFYLSLAGQADANAWEGFTSFFLKAAKEELDHAEGFRSFLVARNLLPKVGSINAPQGVGTKPLEWVDLALKAEQENTKRIYSLYEMALADKDYDSLEFLDFYLKEQRLSERELYDLTVQLAQAGSFAATLLIEKRVNGGS